VYQSQTRRSAAGPKVRNIQELEIVHFSLNITSSLGLQQSKEPMYESSNPPQARTLALFTAFPSIFFHQPEVGSHSRSSNKGAMSDMYPDGSLQKQENSRPG